LEFVGGDNALQTSQIGKPLPARVEGLERLELGEVVSAAADRLGDARGGTDIDVG
jgi:hypothetical protein